MRNERVRKHLEALAGHHICADCAGAFVAILDRVRDEPANDVQALIPVPALLGPADPEDAAEGVGDDSGRSP